MNTMGTGAGTGYQRYTRNHVHWGQTSSTALMVYSYPDQWHPLSIVFDTSSFHPSKALCKPIKNMVINHNRELEQTITKIEQYIMLMNQKPPKATKSRSIQSVVNQTRIKPNLMLQPHCLHKNLP